MSVCRRGHDVSGENLLLYKRGARYTRVCRACRHLRYEQQRAAVKQQSLAWSRAHPARRAEIRKNWQEKNKERRREQWRVDRKRRYEAYRTAALAAYGNCCACCGETEPRYLEFDHIKNDGKRHRQEMRVRGTFVLYTWLKQHGYPQGLVQLLCANCHRAKTSSAACPHPKFDVMACVGAPC